MQGAREMGWFMDEFSKAAGFTPSIVTGKVRAAELVDYCMPVAGADGEAASLHSQLTQHSCLPACLPAQCLEERVCAYFKAPCGPVSRCSRCTCMAPWGARRPRGVAP